MFVGITGRIILASRSQPTPIDSSRLTPHLPGLHLHPSMSLSHFDTSPHLPRLAFDPAERHYTALSDTFSLPTITHMNHSLDLSPSFVAATVRSKNSSIADLRLKARQHQEALGLENSV